MRGGDMSLHKPESGRYVNYTTQTSSDVGAVQSWPSAREDSLASISRDAVLIIGSPAYEDELPFPDKDISPTLQRALKRKFYAGEFEGVDKEAFLKLLGKSP